jgi:hypothetical protein
MLAFLVYSSPLEYNVLEKCKKEKKGFGERGRNNFEALSNANSSQKPQQQVPLKDHK